MVSKYRVEAIHELPLPDILAAIDSNIDLDFVGLDWLNPRSSRSPIV